MPQHSIHSSKKEAIVQLCNFLCVSSVTDIAQLCDGDILLKTIEENFPSFVIDSQCNYIVKDILDAIDSKENVENEKNTDVPANRDTDSNFNFNCIQKFIDDRYGIKSCEIISYAECLEKVEFEIFKVALFVLSEIIKLLLDKDQGHLETLYHLDVKHQVELQDFFKLFISERGKISKELVEKLLLKSSVKSSPFLTPVRHSPRHKQRKSISPTTSREDVFSNSPLKGYFESPIFKKEDISVKEREIGNLKKRIEEADEEIAEHQCKILEFEKKLITKDQQIQKLQRQISDLKDHMQVLQNSCQSESCKTEKEILIKRCKDADYNYSFQTERLYENSILIRNLEEEKSKLEKQLKEERAKSVDTSIGTISVSPAEYQRLVDKVKHLELKIFSYKKQLSEKIITDLKAKEFSGNSSKLNKTYEELWTKYDILRKEDQENLGFLIQEDNRRFCAENRDLKKKNEELLKKIEILQKNASRKRIASSSTDTQGGTNLEKLRKSISRNEDIEDVLASETLFNFNNSDNSIRSEEQQPVLKSDICSGKSPEAVLWTVFNKEPETEISDDINFSHVSAHSNATSSLEIEDVEMENAEAENTEACVSPCQDKKYMFGNLNFGAFLNELKKLTKNGSFQKVLQVLDKINNKMETRISKTIDIQELLTCITECLCVVNLNSKSVHELKDKSVGTEENKFPNSASIPVLQDKSIGTEENEFPNSISNHQEISVGTEEIELVNSQFIPVLQEKCVGTEENEFPNHNIDMECDDCKKYENELVQVENKLEECIKERDKLNSEFQECKSKAIQKDWKLERVTRNYEADTIYWEKVKKKYEELKAGYSQLANRNKKLLQNYENCRMNYNSLARSNRRTEKYNELLKNKLAELKLELQKSCERIKKLQEEKENRLGTGTTSLNTNETFVEEQSSINVTDVNSNVSQDATNESAMSVALDRNHYVTENEEDFVYSNSLSDTTERSRVENNREERALEIMRRNSLLPIHLQSNYSVEPNVNPQFESFYVKNGMFERYSKKRKLADQFSEPSTSFQSWNSKISQRFKSSTPKRLSDMVKRVYNNTHNKLSAKPKK